MAAPKKFTPEERREAQRLNDAKWRNGWDTERELQYIRKGIGFYTTPEQGSVKAHIKAILEGYIKACKKRVNWGQIDKDAVIKAANSRLSTLTWE